VGNMWIAKKFAMTLPKVLAGGPAGVVEILSPMDAGTAPVGDYRRTRINELGNRIGRKYTAPTGGLPGREGWATG
jgi:hypothetical protein